MPPVAFAFLGGGAFGFRIEAGSRGRMPGTEGSHHLDAAEQDAVDPVASDGLLDLAHQCLP